MGFSRFHFNLATSLLNSGSPKTHVHFATSCLKHLVK